MTTGSSRRKAQQITAKTSATVYNIIFCYRKIGHNFYNRTANSVLVPAGYKKNIRMLGETTIKFFKSRTPVLAKRKIKPLEKLEREAVTLRRSILTLQCIGVYGYPLYGEKPFWGYTQVWLKRIDY